MAQKRKAKAKAKGKKQPYLDWLFAQPPGTELPITRREYMTFDGDQVWRHEVFRAKNPALTGEVKFDIPLMRKMTDAEKTAAATGSLQLNFGGDDNAET